MFILLQRVYLTWLGVCHETWETSKNLLSMCMLSKDQQGSRTGHVHSTVHLIVAKQINLSV